MQPWRGGEGCWLRPRERSLAAGPFGDRRRVVSPREIAADILSRVEATGARSLLGPLAGSSVVPLALALLWDVRCGETRWLMPSLIRSPFLALVLVLAVGVCVLVAKLADSTPSGDQPPSPPATIKHIPPAAVNEAEPPSLSSTEVVAGASAPSPKPDPLPASEPGDAVPTQLPLKLLGTMTSSDPRMSLAIVSEDTTQHSRTVWTGSTIQGAKILTIGRTRLWLSNKGRVEFLDKKWLRHPPLPLLLPRRLGPRWHSARPSSRRGRTRMSSSAAK